MATIRVGNKDRPTVDPKVFALAEVFLSDHHIRADTADAASDRLEDATWDLAAAIQQAIEDWLEDAVANGRIEER